MSEAELQDREEAATLSGFSAGLNAAIAIIREQQQNSALRESHKQWLEGLINEISELDK